MTTEHREEDDTATPQIGLQGAIALPGLYHLGCRIAW